MPVTARKLCIAMAIFLAMQSSAILACGYCVEDKIASVYDHAVVTRALALKHQILFFAIDGKLASTAAERQFLEQAAASADGVDAGSARVSVENATLSLAYDPARASFASVERSLQSKIAHRSLRLQLLRIMDKPAALVLPTAKTPKGSDGR